VNKNKRTEKARKEAQKLTQETERTEEAEQSKKANKTKKLSKALSFVLRHNPDSVGITLDDGGWTDVDLLCKAMNRSERPVTREILEQVVADNDKQRFEFDDNKRRIRARQGHSIDIDLQYEPVEPPKVLYHGTAKRFLGSIFNEGLNKGHRHHVHMSTNRETMIAVGTRHGKPVVLQIDAQKMHADGHQFFVTGNSVWLTDHVPPQYLTAMY